MNASLFVSIITPLYNRVTLVGETIDSVIRQTHEHWELLIVDDNSTDGSYEYAANRAELEPRIRVFQRHREPKGAPTCRNIGLEQAQGMYILFLDSDDLLAPHCLQQRTQAMQQYSDHDLLVFPIQYFEHTISDREDIFFRYFYQDYITSFLLKSHWITMSPIWKKEALVRLGGFDEQLACMQDGDLHLRALLSGMKFLVFRNAVVDGYLRTSDQYARISNRLNVTKLDSKVIANQKMLQLLTEHQLLTPIRERMIAAHFLNISWNYRLLGKTARAWQLWKNTCQQGMVTSWSFHVGRSFIYLRSLPIIRNSRILAGAIKRVHQLLLPRFLLWL